MLYIFLIQFTCYAMKSILILQFKDWKKEYNSIHLVNQKISFSVYYTENHIKNKQNKYSLDLQFKKT